MLFFNSHFSLCIFLWYNSECFNAHFIFGIIFFLKGYVTISYFNMIAFDALVEFVFIFFIWSCPVLYPPIALNFMFRIYSYLLYYNGIIQEPFFIHWKSLHPCYRQSISFVYIFFCNETNYHAFEDSSPWLFKLF